MYEIKGNVMTAFLQAHQLNIMLVEIGMCAMLVLLTLVINTLSKKRKMVLCFIEIGAIIMLTADRYAYKYRGNTSELGWWMVRISNFLVFFSILFLLNAFTDYLISISKEDLNISQPPKNLLIARALYFIGAALIIISQFTGLYYTFDENNIYHRSPAFIICYIIPLLIYAFQLKTILRWKNGLDKLLYSSLILFTVVPLAASIAQIFMYGVSLTNITIVWMVIVVFLFAFLDLNRKVEKANRMEVDFLKKEQTKIRNLFNQTTEALTDAIDAKDEYTRGHSGRVAEYAVKIAREAGMDNRSCEEIYFAALLHDVGKIGIPDDIINKTGKLTSHEYDIIKDHPVIGSRILSVITESPFLSLGAHYHHEQYDGSGYPDGLSGDEIPEIARIISIADAYDAMTSERSYRKPYPQAKVRSEIAKGIGTQFDPFYGKIMLDLIDRDVDFTMKDSEDYK